MDDSREACFHCHEMIALGAQVCPHCRREVLVAVSLAGPVQDPRLRYKIARSLVALGPPLTSFPIVQQALSAPRPLVAMRVTRELARRIAAVLEADGIPCEEREVGAWTASLPGVAPPAPDRHYASPLALVGWLAALIVVFAAAGWYAWWLYQKDAKEAAARPPAATGGLPAMGKTSPTAERPPDVPALTTREIAERGLPATVSLRCPDSIASGFFVRSDVVLTNAHALCTGGNVMKAVLSDGRETNAYPLSTDIERDLATLRLSELKGQPATLGDAGSLKVGDKVMMIGSPMGLEFTVHEGLVSSLSRSIEGVAFIQIDAKVNPGNSGGPLFDDRGRVVGVVSRKHVMAEGIALALPINYAYVPPANMASPSSGTPFSEGFQAMVARAKGEALDAKGARKAEQLPDQALPMLVAISYDRVRQVVIHVALPARTRPEYKKLSLQVSLRGELLCTVPAEIYEWTLFEGNPELAIIQPDLLPAIRKRAVLGTLYLGSTTLNFDRCPQERMRWQSDATIENADPAFSTFKITAH